MRLDKYLEKHLEIEKISEAHIRVKVADPYGSYGGKYAGCYGTLERSRAGVRLDDKTNKASSYGLFWFQQNELEVVEDEYIKEENEMAISGNYKVAVVKHPTNYGFSEASFSFALYPTEEVEVGDYVLCDTSNGCQVGKIEEICEKDDAPQKPTKEVICKLDFTNFNARKTAREDRRKLKAKMDAMLKESQELLLYQAIAKDSPEMASMLEQYKALGDV